MNLMSNYLTGISIVGFLVGLGGISVGVASAILCGIVSLIASQQYPLWKSITQFLLIGGGVLMLISFGTCLATFPSIQHR